jgi:hypothetical protein
MKRLLYACQDRHFSVQKTWRELWTYFIKSLTETAYLYNWHDGIKIGGATLKHETIAFFNALSWVLELFHKFVIRKGVKHDSTNYQWWGRFQEVNSRADLSDKTECPICFSDYTFHSEITAALLPSDPRPVKLSCNHILCLPCLRQWTV